MRTDSYLLADASLPFILTRRLVENIFFSVDGQNTILESALPIDTTLDIFRRKKGG